MSKHFRIPRRLPVKLQELGVRVPALLRDAGLPASLLEQPRMVVTTEELFAFWRAIGRAGAETSAGAAIGLELGTETDPTKYDAVMLTALSSANFGEAMRQVSRYKQLSCPEEVAHEMDAVEWRVQFRWLLAEVVEPEVLTDVCFAWVLNIARTGTGRGITPVRIELSQPRSYAKAMERHFGCRIKYGAARNVIVFRRADAELPFVTRNAELLAMLAPQLDEALKEQKGQESFSERVRATIQRKIVGRRPKMGEVARELHMSVRTLQRRLQEDGHSFQQVLETARHQMARHYLKNPGLELTEAAYLLGYEDSNSFVRAFRTWEGTPPAHWREMQRGKSF